MYIHHIFLICPSVAGHLGFFLILAIINTAAVNTGVHATFQMNVFIFSVSVPRDEVPGSCGRTVFTF